MPQFQSATYFTMKGGLNTEASPLNIPQSDATSICNVDINIDGSIERRRSINFLGPNSAGTLYQTSNIADYSGKAEVPSFTQFNPITSNGMIDKYVVLHLGSEFRIYNYNTPDLLRDIGNTVQTIGTGFGAD